MKFFILIIRCTLVVEIFCVTFFEMFSTTFVVLAVSKCEHVKNLFLKFFLFDCISASCNLGRIGCLFIRSSKIHKNFAYVWLVKIDEGEVGEIKCITRFIKSSRNG